jgi:RNA polymerase sigma factor (TIGR02999 family)
VLLFAPETSDLAAGDITSLLDRWTQGDHEAVQALTPLVYSHLRKVAGSYLRRERSDHTLEATGLVNELFLVLLNEKRAKFEDRVHFFTFAARAMRRILVDHARTRQRAKRGLGEAHVELSPDLAWVDPDGPEMLDLDRALDEMESMEPRKARVVELRIFLGCTSAEAAELMGISKPTLDRDLRFALAWLFDRMKGPA